MEFRKSLSLLKVTCLKDGKFRARLVRLQKSYKWGSRQQRTTMSIPLQVLWRIHLILQTRPSPTKQTGGPTFARWLTCSRLSDGAVSLDYIGPLNSLGNAGRTIRRRVYPRRAGCGDPVEFLVVAADTRLRKITPIRCIKIGRESRHFARAAFRCITMRISLMVDFRSRREFKIYRTCI